MTSFDLELIVEIGLTADLLNEIEGQRKRAANRRGAMTRSTPDADGVVRGHGFREESYPVMLLDSYLESLAAQETMMIKALEGAMRRHPLAAWIRQQRGLGLKQMGRLLAVLQDPSWHPVEERPRTLPELYAYCGQVPGFRRARGVPAEESPQWSSEARMRVHLVAEQIVKMRRPECREGHVQDCACGSYRLVYEERRAWTADRLHTEPCVRCGPSGHPAPAGSPWPASHQHGDALRYVGKRILRDLWREARRVNGYSQKVPLAS